MASISPDPVTGGQFPRSYSPGRSEALLPPKKNLIYLEPGKPGFSFEIVTVPMLPFQREISHPLGENRVGEGSPISHNSAGQLDHPFVESLSPLPRGIQLRPVLRPATPTQTEFLDYPTPPGRWTGTRHRQYKDYSTRNHQWSRRCPVGYIDRRRRSNW